MSYRIMELTESEILVIEKMREEEAIKNEVKRKTVSLLSLARDYQIFLNTTGCGSTYSTFCADYGKYEGEDRARVFSAIEILRKVASENA